MRPLLLLAAVVSLAVGLLAAPVGAVDTTAEFQVTAQSGGLQLTQDSGTADLGSAAYDFASSQSLSGSLPETTLTDERGSLSAGWTVTVSAGGPFTNGSESVALSNAHVYMNAADASALASALGGLLNGMSLSGGEFNGGTNDLSSSYTLLTGTTTTLLGLGSPPSVTYTPAIDVTVPANTPTGTYTTTITQTAS